MRRAGIKARARPRLAAEWREDELAPRRELREPCEVLEPHRFEQHAVARRQKGRLAAAMVPEGDRGAPDDVEAAGRLFGEHAGHPRGDADRSRRDPRSRGFPAGKRELLRKVAEIGLPRQEPEHVNMVDHARMAGSEGFGRHAGAAGGVLEVRSDLGVVADGQPPEPARARDRRRIGDEVGYATRQRIEPDPRRVEADHQGSKRRDSFDDPGDRGDGEPVGECKDSFVELQIDAVAELDHQRRVAIGEDPASLVRRLRPRRPVHWTASEGRAASSGSAGMNQGLTATPRRIEYM